MIIIKLSGGLGNGMFQYAAARTLAQKRKYSFCHFPLRGRRFYLKRLMQLIYRFRNPKAKIETKQIAQSDIENYYTLGDHGFVRYLVFRFFWYISLKSKITTSLTDADSLDQNSPAPALISDSRHIGNWCELKGSFQSEAFFVENRKSILEWYTLKPKYRDTLKIIEDKFSAPPEERCCIHVRRGDYLIMDKGLAWRDQGWALPLEYYKAAVSNLPKNLLYVIVTDSPEYVEEHFDFLDNTVIMRDNSEIIDMHLFTLCRYNIIANSTFSWWGAWLNEHEEKQIIAPKYHLGWAKKCWLPRGHENHPLDWSYIDTLELVEN